jgi:hypothetical protein
MSLFLKLLRLLTKSYYPCFTTETIAVESHQRRIPVNDAGLRPLKTAAPFSYSFVLFLP